MTEKNASQATSGQDAGAASITQKEDGKLASATSAPAAKQAAYFIEAQSWADDLYTAAVTSRNRYQVAFLATLV